MKPGDRVRVSISFDNADNYSPGIAKALNGARGKVDCSYDNSSDGAFVCVNFDKPYPKLRVGSYEVNQANYWFPISDVKKE